MFMESGRALKAPWLASCPRTIGKPPYHMTDSSIHINGSWVLVTKLGKTSMRIDSQVKTCMLAFEESSIYGNRSGFQELLLITSNDGKNVFHASPGWKRQVVTGVSMLQRQDMSKMPRGKWGSEGRFTKVQEMKQDKGFDQT